MQPLLSICIPTYNRAEYLANTIESIICQSEFLSGEVEIVVSDNASTDNTNEVCEKYSMYENFFYFRNSENVTDQNFPIVLSRAHGKLRKLNNDTFVLNKSSLKNLCDITKKYDNTRPLIHIRNEGDTIKELDFRNFVLDVGYWITWIGGFTIWEDECNHIDTDTDGCELSLWQVRKAYELANKKNAAVVYYQNIGETVILPRKDISYGLYQVFYCNYMKMLQPFLISGVLRTEDIEYLEKELLFGFFLIWVIKYEFINTEIQFSREENVKAAIWDQYKDKPYWSEFEKKYKRKLLEARVKHLIKMVIRWK